MAAPTTVAVTPDTPITIKITIDDVTKRLKLPLRDLSAAVLPIKLRHALEIDPAQRVVLERYSDSVGGYIVLDENNPQVFKTLIRAAKAKLKLRLKATVTPLTMPAIQQPDVFSTPAKPAAVQDNTSEPRNIGNGIFQFRDARASQPSLISFDDAPTPKPFTPSSPAVQRANPEKLVIRNKESGRTALGSAWSVHCNECDKALSNEHFHCSICDEGDYDLCSECVEQGKGCHGEDHWLIKRHIVDGKVVASTTERVARKQTSVEAVTPKVEKPVEMAPCYRGFGVAPATAAPSSRVSIESLLTPTRNVSSAFAEETKTLAEDPHTATRTCNSCVIILPERDFVTCDSCEDFDLCIKCHADDQHGHHPAHSFKPATKSTVLSFASTKKLAAGRGIRHNAICDGCDANITGVRHKCLTCPDWDYCNQCVKFAGERHATHRFVAIYEPIADVRVTPACHVNVMCDGPLCSAGNSNRYIYGVRYKCTICHDTDFCASCEAHPSNKHNPTHPLLKLKTPVRNVSVSTENQVQSGQVRILGDRRCPAAHVAEKTSPVQANSATPVQTVAEIKPIEIKKEEPVSIPVKKYEPSPVFAPQESLQAHFVRDTITDGQTMSPGARFVQVWTMKNAGSVAWPAGCAVRYTGGDSMLDLDPNRCGPTDAITVAGESNVVARAVQPGEEVAFKVGLRAPPREGKSISYWRLKGPDGQAFGHRLWCDITVKKIAAPPAPASPATTFDEMLPAFRGLTCGTSNVSATALPPTPALLTNFDTTGLSTDAIERLRVLHEKRQAKEKRKQAEVRVQAEAAAAAVRAQQATIAGENTEAMLEAQEMQEDQIRRFERIERHDRQMAELIRLNALNEQKKQQLGSTSYLPSAPPLPKPNYLPNWGQGFLPVPPPYYPPALRAQASMPQLSPNPYTPAWATRHVPQAPMPPNMYNSPANSSPRHSPTSCVGYSPYQSTYIPQRPIPAPVAAPPPALPAVTTAAATAASHDEYARIQKILLEHAKNTAPEEDVKTTDTPLVEEVVAATEEEENLERSSMVFPKLDKESPASSTYQSLANSVNKGKAAYVENEAGEVEDVAVPATTVAAAAAAVAAPAASSVGSHDEYEDFDDELEVLSATGQESDEDEEDGFATDEEYDILDASDEETVA